MYSYYMLLYSDVRVGNASGINDGAALCLLMSAVKEGKGLRFVAFGGARAGLAAPSRCPWLRECRGGSEDHGQLATSYFMSSQLDST